MNGKIGTKIGTPVFLGFTVLAALAISGCIVEDHSSGGTCADNRYVSVTWDIVKDVNNVPLSCDQANAATVQLYLDQITFPAWPCSWGTASTDSGLQEGSYQASMQLFAPDGTPLSDTAVPNGPSTLTISHCAPTYTSVTFGVQ